jgi:hypothetical protein
LIASIRRFNETLIAGARAMLGRPLTPAQNLRPAAHFWGLVAMSVVLSIASDWWWVTAPRAFSVDGLQRDAFAAVLTLLFATGAAHAVGQRVLSWSIAVHLSSAALLTGTLTLAAYATLISAGWMTPTVFQSWYWGSIAWWSVSVLAICWVVLKPSAAWRRLALGLLGAAVTTAPYFYLNVARYWQYDVMAAAMAEPETPAREVPGSAEQVWGRQPAMVDQALAKLRRGVPDNIDAYALVFGADGNEDVFRNEAEYVDQLLRQRFAMDGRSLSLINHPDTTDVTPLATLSNLRRALAGIAARMDRDEDVLFLFATTHGTEDHQLYVDLDPLPLDWIAPQDLRAALDDAGITWRVLVVSACYSGGFIDALKSPTTLVVTAARSDRTSFGCGTDSEITYFGRAYFVDALNRTTDWIAAFEIAKELVLEREKAQDFEPSEPQIEIGALVGPRLAAWRDALRAGPPLAFVPTIAKACKADASCGD